ncbi:MAG: dephospho-CoA kinase [Lachnospiraceae bacterium]|nr:dephospho-CoA kinase [Lachnospiraceae bacterium]
MRVIGLTGGIGSGKSWVAEVIREEMHWEVIYTDDVAREQMKKGGASYFAVVKEFGEEILSTDGEIDRGKLAKIVFEDKTRLMKLNSLTHPLVRTYVLNEIARFRKENKEAVLIETALLIEAGYQEFCDEVWYVHAPESERRERLKKSRGYSDEKVDTLFVKQRNEKEFFDIATKVIENPDETTPADIIGQIIGR